MPAVRRASHIYVIIADCGEHRVAAKWENTSTIVVNVSPNICPRSSEHPGSYREMHEIDLGARATTSLSSQCRTLRLTTRVAVFG